MASAASAQTLKAKACERRARDFLVAEGWSFLAADLECMHVQVDLLFRSPEGILSVVEVKSVRLEGGARVSRKQWLRLFRVATVLAEVEPVQMILAGVRGSQVRITPVDGLTLGLNM